MHKESIVYDKLAQIHRALTKNESQKEDIGVLSGDAGIALFHFYYSRLMNDASIADDGVKVLTSIIEKINNGYNFYTYCSGIGGAAWAIQLLEQEDFVDLDCDELLGELDLFLFPSVQGLQHDPNFYDFLHGILGVAYYFLKRYECTTSSLLKERYRTILLDILRLLDQKAIIKGNTIKWESYLERKKGIKGYNLALSHGIPSIINFLSRLVVYKDFKTPASKLLNGALNFVLEFKNKDNDNNVTFPSWVTSDGKKNEYSRLAWCYGDLGVGITLWKAGVVLQNEKYKEEAIAVLTKSANRRDLKEASVEDAGLCHGAYGVMHMYDHMYKETGEKVCKESADFWLDQGLKMAIHTNGLAGYMKWQGGDQAGWKPEINLLGGVSGIGLAMISYLAPFDTKWNECLLIG